MAYTKEVKPTTSNSLVAKPTTTNTPAVKPITTNTKVNKPATVNTKVAKSATVFNSVEKDVTTYSGVVKPGTTNTLVEKDTDTFLKHLYPALLCEDGSDLMQEDGIQRICLEWYFTLGTEPPTTNTKEAKPATVWSL